MEAECGNLPSQLSQLEHFNGILTIKRCRICPELDHCEILSPVVVQWGHKIPQVRVVFQRDSEYFRVEFSCSTPYISILMSSLLFIWFMYSSLRMHHHVFILIYMYVYIYIHTFIRSSTCIVSFPPEILLSWACSTSVARSLRPALKAATAASRRRPREWYRCWRRCYGADGALVGGGLNHQKYGWKQQKSGEHVSKIRI